MVSKQLLNFKKVSEREREKIDTVQSLGDDDKNLCSISLGITRGFNSIILFIHVDRRLKKLG